MSTLYQTQIPLNNLPFILTLISDGRIALTPSRPFAPILEQQTGEYRVSFWPEGFVVYRNEEGEEYLYNQAIEINDPSHSWLKGWLQQQMLPNPFEER